MVRLTMRAAALGIRRAPNSDTRRLKRYLAGY